MKGFRSTQKFKFTRRIKGIQDFPLHLLQIVAPNLDSSKYLVKKELTEAQRRTHNRVNKSSDAYFTNLLIDFEDEQDFDTLSKAVRFVSRYTTVN